MDFLGENVSLAWLCVIALFSFLELFLMRYWAVWLSVGGTIGLSVSLLGGPAWLQISLAVLVSFGLLWFCRSWAKQVRCEDLMSEISPEKTEKREDSPAWVDFNNHYLDSKEEPLVPIASDSLSPQEETTDIISQILSSEPFLE